MRIAIFDVEGTLVDCALQTIEAWREALLENGVEVTSQTLQHHLGRDGDDMLKIIVPDASRQMRKDLEKRQGALYREKFLPTVRALPNARELFEQLKREGCRIALGTSCQPDELKVYEDLLGICDLVDAVACGKDTKRGKPHPDLFRLALHNLNARPSHEAIAVGDTPYDAQAAKAAGIGAVGVKSGGFSAAALENAGCIAVFQDLTDLLERGLPWPDATARQPAPAAS